MRRTAIAVAALLLVGPVWASNPGEPLDSARIEKGSSFHLAAALRLRQR